MDELQTAALAGAADGAKSVVEAAVKGIANTIRTHAGRVTDRTVAALQIGFSEYLQVSYNRCRFFKSILVPQQPLLVKKYYLNVDMRCGSKIITDFELTQRMPELRRVVVTGLAGTGKSMFMKYITVSMFEDAQGVLPLFIELRHLNNLTNKNLLAFIRTSCSSVSHAVTESQFLMALRGGAFLLILDGFDELHHENREEIERQILALEKDYPRATVLLSSRPDRRFASWHSFHEYSVCPLSKKQTISLIDGLEYPIGVKSRFLKEVRDRLYESHKSFLSSPLLTSIMLLTFEEFADIPQKMHAFYSQAFDTLLQKHDAQKDQYQRRTRTGLTREQFRGCFSAFCAMSYLEQRFSFDDDVLLQTAAAAIKYTRDSQTDFPQDVSPQALIDDLFESVCMLQKDGIQSSFVHRSFQEYFAALFVTLLPGERVKKFLDRYSWRFHDSVIGMATDMSRAVIEDAWILPSVERLEMLLFPQKEIESSGVVLSRCFTQVEIDGNSGLVWFGPYSLPDNAGPLEAICRLYPEKLGAYFLWHLLDEFRTERIRETVLQRKYRGRPGFRAIELAVKQAERPAGTHPVRGSKERNLAKIDDEASWWLDELGTRPRLERLRTAFKEIKREIQRSENAKDEIMSEFFGQH